MVVLSLPECDLGNFQLVRATSFGQTQWYEADISKVLNPRGLEQRSVKIYQQEDLSKMNVLTKNFNIDN